MAKRKNQRGVTIPFVMLLAVVAAILIGWIARALQIQSLQKSSLSSSTNAARLAEMGTNRVLGILSVDPSTRIASPIDDFTRLVLNDGDDIVSSTFSRRSAPGFENGFYVVTTATHTVGNKLYVTRLHTYARVSDIAGYFAAINGPLNITFPVNIGQGNIYCATGTLTINTGAGGPSTLGVVTYTENFVFNNIPPGTPTDVWFAATDGGPNLPYNPATGNAPKQIEKLLFPQLLTSDLLFLKRKATDPADPNYDNGNPPTNGHFVCQFTQAPNIYPPGHASTNALDQYELNPAIFFVPAPAGKTRWGHQTDDSQHVWFCEGDMFVQGIIHGQVLFAATGDIHITSSVVMSSSLNGGVQSDPPSGSPVDQAVFLTRGDIIIDNTIFGANDPTPGQTVTQSIEGLMFAPHGTFRAVPYGTSALTGNPLRNQLDLTFTGALILNNEPDTLLNTFRNRTYSYMPTLRTNPPPYIPALIDVYHSVEEILRNGD